MEAALRRSWALPVEVGNRRPLKKVAEAAVVDTSGSRSRYAEESKWNAVIEGK